LTGKKRRGNRFYIVEKGPSTVAERGGDQNTPRCLRRFGPPRKEEKEKDFRIRSEDRPGRLAQKKEGEERRFSMMFQERKGKRKIYPNLAD